MVTAQLKRAIKRLMPPLVVDVYHSVREGRSIGPTWAGIYPTLSDVPTKGLGHEDDRWARQCEALARLLISAAKDGVTVPVNVRGRHVLLPLIASSMPLCRQDGIKVLDFGGGVGTDYIHLSASVSLGHDVEYYVVEGEKICRIGAAIFANDPRIRFTPSLPLELPGVDIVQISSTLQYVHHYRDLLERLCRYAAQYMLIANLPAGDIPTYASAQRNLPGSVVAAWFFRIAEIVEIMAHGGYSLVFKGASEEEWDQHNFPASHRIGRPCHLLFVRT